MFRRAKKIQNKTPNENINQENTHDGEDKNLVDHNQMNDTRIMDSAKTSSEYTANNLESQSKQEDKEIVEESHNPLDDQSSEKQNSSKAHNIQDEKLQKDLEKQDIQSELPNSEDLENSENEYLTLHDEQDIENNNPYVEGQEQEKQDLKNQAQYQQESLAYESAGIAQKTFQLLSHIALPTLIVLTIALCCQQFFFPRDFWFSEEVRFADVYMNMLASGNIFHLTLNGLPFAEAGPLYFLSIFAIDSIPGIEMPQVFFIASTLFASLYIAVVWLFARVMGLGKEGAFAAGLIALSTFFFIGLSNYNRMDLLHAALLNLSFLFFYYGWKKKNGFFSLTLAFLFLAMSVLINGILYVAIPFIAGFFFLLWAGKLRRITGGDGLLGFFIFLVLLFSWYGILYFYGQASYINELFKIQVLEPFAIAPYSKPLWYYALGFVLIALPWFLLFFFANWFQNLKSIPTYFKMRKENASTSWLIWILLITLFLLTFTHNKQFINLMPLMPVLAVLLAKILISLSSTKSKLFYIVLAFILFCLGLLFLLFEFHAIVFEYLPKIWILPEEIPTYIAVATTNTHFGMAAMGGIFILSALILWKFTRKTQAYGALLVSSFWMIIAVQPFSMLVAPQLDSILSPKAQASIMAEYAKKGYTPISFEVYPDVYTYYYNEAILQDETIEHENPVYPQQTVQNMETVQELTKFLNTNPLVILAIPVEVFNTLPNKLQAKEIQKQWLESKEIALTVWELPQIIDIQSIPEKQILEEEALPAIALEEVLEETLEETAKEKLTEENQIENVNNEKREEKMTSEAHSASSLEEINQDRLSDKPSDPEPSDVTQKTENETETSDTSEDENDSTQEVVIIKETTQDLHEDKVHTEEGESTLKTPEEVKKEALNIENENADELVQNSNIIPEESKKEVQGENVEDSILSENKQEIEINPEDSFLFDKDLQGTPSTSKDINNL